MKLSRKGAVISLFPVFLCLAAQGCQSLPTLSGQPFSFFYSPTPVITLTASMAVSPSPSPSPTMPSTPSPCNRLSAGQPMDISIPDGSRLRPGEAFSKTWRLLNAGSCAWTHAYALVWFSGAELSQVHSQQLNADVAPGDYIDISVDMAAPMRAGVFQSNWMLKAPDGTFFGLGPAGTSPIWARIEVVDNRTPTASPIPTQTSTPQKLPGGKVPMALNDHVDLDTHTAESSQTDLALILSPQNSIELAPENNASAAVFGESLPSIKDCLKASVNTAPIQLEGLKEGIYLCYVTGQGNPGYARLTRLDPLMNSLSLEYYTWLIPET
jgi:hypothetical protein